MKIILPLPRSFVERLVSLATSRWEGRKEFRSKGTPNICRLTQLAILGVIARLVDRLDPTMDRLSPKGRRVALVVGVVFELACIAGVAFCLVQLYTGYDRSTSMMATGWLGAGIGILVAGLILLIGLGLALRHLARLCPFDVPAISEILRERVQ